VFLKQKETKPISLNYDKNDITYVENNGHTATFHAGGQTSSKRVHKRLKYSFQVKKHWH